jgi:hypothetical protein
LRTREPVIAKRKIRSKITACCTSRAWSAISPSPSPRLDALAERGQVAAQLLERVQEERHPLLDHERVERQVAAHVRAVVDEVPHHEDLFREPLVGEHARRTLGDIELRDLGCRGHDPTEARCFAVLEDRAPREGGISRIATVSGKSTAELVS